MKTITTIFATLTLLFAFGCAQYDDGESNPDCVSDCNGTDPDPDPCDGDECTDPPGPETDPWVCRTGTVTGADYKEYSLRDKYVLPAARSMKPWLSGNCPTEGIVGYWDGRVEPDEIVTDENGIEWARLYYNGESGNKQQPCELTVQFCADPNDPVCWHQYGPTTVGSEEAGIYRECGVRNGVEACGMFSVRKAGHKAEELGYYPN